MPKFKYVGNDAIGKAPEIDLYGTHFKLGEVAEVENEYGAQKLRTVWKGAFEEQEGEDDDNGDAPKKRPPGRPRKTDEEREADKAEREADKAQREAERVRREQEREDAKAERKTVATDLGPDDPWSEDK